jgi:hypothetical protein
MIDAWSSRWLEAMIAVSWQPRLERVGARADLPP